ncbi:MAG: PQQ-binding-like beta-propeller repeat protein [Pseudomonadota bacterium]
MHGWLLPLVLLGAAPAWLRQDTSAVEVQDFSGAFDRNPRMYWQHHLPGGRPASGAGSELGRPGLLMGSVIVGSSASDALYELRRDDGTFIRAFPAGGPVMAEAAVLDDGLLFSDSAGYTWRYTRDGRQVWKHYAGAPVLARPEVVDDTVYVSALDGTVHALDAANGGSRWYYKHPHDGTRASDLELYGAPAPVAAGDLVLVGFHDGSLVALARADGEVQWESRVGEGRYPDLIGPPLVLEHDIYIGGFSSPFVALDLETQNVRWRLDIGVASQAVASGRALYIPGSDGKLRAVDRVTSAELWLWDSLTAGALTSPQLTEAGLLVGSSDGGLWLVDPTTGTERWHLDEGAMLNGVSAAPAIDGRQAMVVTNAGNLISLVVPAPDMAGAHDEQPLWRPPFAAPR